MFRKSNKGRSVWRALRGLMAAWWQVDRVRVSPREGELLRLRPRSLVIVAGVPAEVLRRQETQHSPSPAVDYECQAADGLARLQVRIDEVSGRPAIRWSSASHTRDLWEHEIEVFG